MCGVAAEEDRPVGLWPKAERLGRLDKLGVTGSSPVPPTHEAPATLEVSSSLRPVETNPRPASWAQNGAPARRSHRTSDAEVAYACFPDSEPTQYRDGWLPSS